MAPAFPSPPLNLHHSISIQNGVFIEILFPQTLQDFINNATGLLEYELTFFFL
jgi:hypothetical protein